MKRLLNYRYLLFALVFLIAGMLSAYGYLHGINLVGVSLGFLGFLAIIFLILKKNKVTFFILIMTCVYFVGYFDIVKEYNHSKEEKFIGSEVKLTGFVSDESNLREVGFELVLRNNEVVYQNEKIKLDGKVKYFTLVPSLKEKYYTVGDKVEFLCVLEKVNIFRDGIDSYVYKNKTFWNIVELKEVTNHIILSPNFVESFRINVRSSLLNIMNKEEAGVAQALILGDKGFMDNETKEYFRKSGVSHIFAVSGLHISFVILVTNFLLNLLKVNKKLSLAITMIVIIFYAYLCGFPSSVIRAAVMSFCIMLGDLCGRPKDMLTSISFAALILLIFRPLDLFDAGFLMSFGAVYGICCSTNFFNRFKCFKNNFFLQPIAVTVGATLGTFPFVVSFYGVFSLIGVLLNLIVIPIISVVFILIWVGCIPFLSFVLVLPGYILKLFSMGAAEIAKSPLSSIPINSFGIATIIFLLILFVLGGYFIINKKVKFIIVPLLCVLFGVCSYFSSLPLALDNQFIFYEKGTIVASTKNNFIVYSDFNDYQDCYDINDYCKSHSIKSIKVVVKSNKEALEMLELDKKEKLLDVKVSKLYILDISDDNFNLINENYAVTAIPSNEFLQISDIKFRSVCDGQHFLGLHIVVKNKNAVVFDTFTKGEFAFIKNYLYFPIDILKSNSFIDELSYMFEKNLILTDKRVVNDKVFSSKLYGNFTILVKNDMITLKDMWE